MVAEDEIREAFKVFDMDGNYINIFLLCKENMREIDIVIKRWKVSEIMWENERERECEKERRWDIEKILEKKIESKVSKI